MPALLPQLPRLGAGLAALALASAVHAAPAPAALAPGLHMGEAAQSHPALAKSFQELTAKLQAASPWLKTYGTTMPAVAEAVDGKSYVVFQACKPHDCIFEGYTVMVDPATSQVVGGAFVRNTFDGPRMTHSEVTWFGKVEWDQAVMLGRHLY